ncbi:MAG: hypothetical protein PWQ18_565 [Clostridia bacterium]|nr:hypothetical protein [Clostridia bacterium]
MLGEACCYRQNALICLPQDPHVLYVYWDFTPARWATLREFFQAIHPEMRFTLRLRRHDDQPPEQEVYLPALEPGGHYFSHLDTYGNYQVELGARGPAGEFVLFNHTAVPWRQPVHEEDPAVHPGHRGANPLTAGTSPESEPPASIFAWS